MGLLRSPDQLWGVIVLSISILRSIESDRPFMTREEPRPLGVLENLDVYSTPGSSIIVVFFEGHDTCSNNAPIYSCQKLLGSPDPFLYDSTENNNWL
jgi:hypothetical protein